MAFESERGVRYAGLLEVKEGAIGAAIGLAREKEVYPFSCALVLSDRPGMGSEADVEALFEAAFPAQDRGRDSRVDWQSLSVALCPHGYVVGRTTGAFDDPWVDTDLFLPGDLGEALAGELGAGWRSGPCARGRQRRPGMRPR